MDNKGILPFRTSKKKQTLEEKARKLTCNKERFRIGNKNTSM